MLSRLRGVIAVLSGGLIVLSLAAALFTIIRPPAAVASNDGGLSVSSGAILGPEVALAAIVGAGGLFFVLRPRRPVD